MKKTLAILAIKCRALLRGGGLFLLLALTGLCAYTVGRVLTAERASKISIALVDNDGSGLSLQLEEALKQEASLLVIKTDEKGARRLIASGRAEGVLIVNAGYSEALRQGESAVAAYRAAPFSSSAAAAREIIGGKILSQQIYSEALATAKAAGLIADGGEEAFEKAYREASAQQGEPVLFTLSGGGAVTGEALFSNPKGRAAGFAGLLLLLVLLSLSQFLSDPATRAVNGRLLCRQRGAAFAFLTDNGALLLPGLLFTGTVYLCLGSVRPPLLPLCAYTFAAAGLSSFLSAFRKSPGTDALSPYLALLTSLLGGCFFDVSLLSPLFQTLSLLTPQGLLIWAAKSGDPLPALLLFAAGLLLYAISFIREKRRRP